MKKISSLLLIATVAWALAFGVSAERVEYRKPAKYKLPEGAREIEPDFYSLGVAKDVDGTLVEGYAFIHRRRKDVRGGGSKKPGGSTCYSFLASGARWKATEPYLINTANSDNLSLAFIASTFAQGIEEWDKYVSFDLFGLGTATTSVLSAETSSPDGLNEVFFSSIDDPGVIAVTTTWGIYGGPPQNRKLVEWDMVFNDPDFVWGDALANASLMDFENIAVHELGHAAGLGHPSDSCAQETMYRFASNGETKKRDLNTGDIQGIQKLYQ